jgi:hypothetical protein
MRRQLSLSECYNDFPKIDDEQGDGRILMFDKKNIEAYGLHEIRKKVTIIPQDPGETIL